MVFQWGYYKDHLAEIFNIRKGGLAIYGGIIAAVVTLIVFTRKRKLSFLSMADSACLGLVTGQIIGRWGNFVNCEAFGGYTDSLFAMRIKRSIVNESMISQELLENLITENGIEYIQVHPTFLLRIHVEPGASFIYALVQKEKEIYRRNVTDLSYRIWNRTRVDRRASDGPASDPGNGTCSLSGIIHGDRGHFPGCSPVPSKEGTRRKRGNSVNEWVE